MADHYIRVTFDRVELDIMTTSSTHELDRHLLGRLVDTLTEEMAIDVACAGTMTLDREELERGLEGDNIWWIQHEPQVRHVRKIDLNRVPPPDLALEVEISRSALDRMGIYAALRVPEVWRWDQRVLSVWLLKGDEYVRSAHSLAFPFLPVAELARFMLMRTTMSETQVVRAFREWVREHLQEWKAAPGQKPTQETPGGKRKKRKGQ